MEQSFALKKLGNLSLNEQAWMIADDRAWWMKRIERDLREQAEKEKNRGHR